MQKLSPLNYALYLLKLRDRTVGEIQGKMKQKGFEEVEISQTVEFLKSKKLLDDERFAANYIQNKQQFGSTGKYKIKFKLEQLKVDKEIINQKLSQIEPESEYDRALNLGKNWFIKKQSVPAEKRYERLGRFLIGRGFEINIVKDVLADILKKRSDC